MNTNQQFDVSEQRRLPVDNVGTDKLVTVTGETVQLYYYNGTALTIDAGQAAGTVVVGKLAHRNVKNQIGDVTATHKDTSLTFTSTALTSEQPFPYLTAGKNDTADGSAKASAVTTAAGLINGEYCVDYRTGLIYGLKADASVTLTTTSYNVETSTSSTPVGAAVEVTGTVAQGSAVQGNPVPTALEAADFDGAALPNAVDEGDVVRPKGSLSGVQYVMLVNEDGSAQPAYDSGADANKDYEVDPISEHHEESTLADVTNGADGTYNYYVDMDGYKSFSLQSTLSGGSGTATLTVEATNQDDGTAAASCTYIDVTNTLFGVASTTASSFWFADTAPLMKYLKVKVVANTGGADDADWTLYLKKAY